MDLLEGRASLGRTEPWLRAVGLAIWAFVGVSRLYAPSAARTPLWLVPWLVPWLVYGAAGALATQRARLPVALSVALLATQSLAVLVLPRLGFLGFEGLLLSIVVAQAPTVLSFRHAVIWTVAQVPPLMLAVRPFKSALERLEILGAYSAFAAFTLLVYHVHLRERRARAELARAHVALVSTHALLIENTRQNERLRISRELHDSLGHHLTAMSLQLELAMALSEGPVAKPVAAARAISKESLSEVRRAVSAMQSVAPMDLVAALRALAASIPAPRIAVDAAQDIVIEDGEVRHAVLRCVQEAMTNCVKHASADKVRVELVWTPNGLDIKVCDDGRGVDHVTPGRGLDGIAARVAQVGGKAEFRSKRGHGFEVHLSLPARAVRPIPSPEGASS